MKKNLERSLLLFEMIRPSCGQCFGTASQVSEQTGAWYVEGTFDGIPHGWNELDGEILDAQLPHRQGEYHRIRRCSATAMAHYKGALPRFIFP